MISLKNKPSLDTSSSAARPSRAEEDRSGAGASETPRAFEAICLDLIGGLDGLLIEAIEYRRLSQYGNAAAAGNQMLLSVLDFAEGNLEGQALQDVQDRVADAYEKSKQVDRLLATQSWRAVRRVLGQATAASSDVAEAHRELGEAIAVVVITSVASGGDRLHLGSNLAKQMAHSLRSFIESLRTEWSVGA